MINLSPTPKESILAPWYNNSWMIYSSKELLTIILQSLYPALSNIFLIFLVRYAISPLSILIPTGRLPSGFNTSSKA